MRLSDYGISGPPNLVREFERATRAADEAYAEAVALGLTSGVARSWQSHPGIVAWEDVETERTLAEERLEDAYSNAWERFTDASEISYREARAFNYKWEMEGL